jgi:hypothetical protein
MLYLSNGVTTDQVITKQDIEDLPYVGKVVITCNHQLKIQAASSILNHDCLLLLFALPLLIEHGANLGEPGLPVTSTKDAVLSPE